MNLQELQDNKKTKIVKRALREHYEIDMDFDSLSLTKTQAMLVKVKGLLKESRAKTSTHSSHKNNGYLKLVMLEQALTDHLSDLRNPYTKIVIENEEVQKSQVILAAQDMIDSIQKMLEQVSKMNVEELNAVTDGIKNEFGTAEGDAFNATVSETLNGLMAGLTAAKNSITSALGVITGEGDQSETGMGDMEMGAASAPMADQPEMGAPGAGVEAGVEASEEEPEELSGVGRERR